MSLSIALSPGGHLVVQPDDQAEPKLSQATVAHLGEAFSVSTTRGLETRASEFLHEPLPPTFVFWRGFAQRLFAALCHNSSLENASTIVISRPVETELTAMAESAPPMTGLEYLNSAILRRLWDELDAHVHAAIGRTPGGAAAYLKKCNPTWNAVGRATFHLAENKRNRAYPFGFLATYTNRVSEQGKVQHVFRWRNTSGQKTGRRWRRCFRPSKARPNRANWHANCWIPAPSFIRRFGGGIKPSRSCRTSPLRAKRPGRPHSGLVEGGPSTAAASQCANRRGQGKPARQGKAAGFPGGFVA
jgi:hypothetical protein